MSSPSDSLERSAEVHETKSDVVRDNSLDLPPAEAIGLRPEDHDLSQFGYKAELEVSTINVAESAFAHPL